VNRADLPGFVKSLFSMRGLSVRASGAAGSGWMALRDLDARGDGASVRATLRKENGVQRGALQLTVRGVSLGIDLDHGGHAVQLIKPGIFSSRASRARAGRPGSRRAPAATGGAARPAGADRALTDIVRGWPSPSCSPPRSRRPPR